MEWNQFSIEYLLLIVENLSFMYCVLRKRLNKNIKRKSWLVFFLFWLVLSGIVIKILNDLKMVPLVCIFIPIAVSLYLAFETPLLEMLGFILLQYLMLSNIELSISVCVNKLNLVQIIDKNMEMIIVIVLIWFFYLFVGRKINETLLFLQKSILFLIDGIMLILTAMIEFFSFVLSEILEYKANNIGYLLIAFGGVIICFSLILIIYYFNHTQILTFQKNYIEKQNEQQREYFQQLLEKEEETKRFRHDIINDLIMLQNYCKSEKYEDLSKYLDSSIGTIVDISKSNYDVGNDIVNTALNYYLKPLKKKCEIEVEGYIGNDLNIDQRDLCIIVSNIVKNAVEAVQDAGKGKIQFQIKQGNHYISIKLTNTHNKEIMIDKNGIPVTSKKDVNRHGFGLKNVIEMIKSNEGRYNFNITDNSFMIHIFVKI